MQELGINVAEEFRFYPFRATFDFECYFDNAVLPLNSPKVDCLARHELLGVSVCSNVPGFSLPYCFINEGDPSQLVDRFVDYLNKISDAAYNILKNDYKEIFDSLQNMLEMVKGDESMNGESCCDVINDNDDDAKIECEPHGIKISIVTSKDIYKLIASFKGFLRELPVIGFNSGRYDLNLIKKYIAPYLLTTCEPHGIEISIVTSKDIYKLIASFKGFLRELPVTGFNSGRYNLNLINKYIAPYLLRTNVDDDAENDKTDGDKHIKNVCSLSCATLFMCLKPFST